MKERKVPLRMCTGCGERKEKKELIRIVKNSEGDIFIDETGKANGRGAYLCKKEECLKKSINKGALSRSLDAKVEDDVFEKLKGYYESQ